MNCRLLSFFNINFFEKILFRSTIRVSNSWIQIRPDIMSALIWIQTVCKVSAEYMSRKKMNLFGLLIILSIKDQHIFFNSIKYSCYAD